MNAIRHLRFKHLFPYLEKIVGSHTSDKRIFLWDICNEPFNTASSPEIRNIILKWLKEICLICKNLGAEIPLCTGTIPNIDTVKLVEPVSDVITIHPYGAWNAWVKDKKDFEGFLDEAASFANQSKKPLLASECSCRTMFNISYFFTSSIFRYILASFPVNIILYQKEDVKQKEILTL